MTHPSQEAQKLSDLMRTIDAYAYDYKVMGKAATARLFVERELTELLRSQQPVSGGEDWLEEQDFYEAMQGYRCAPREDQREVMAHFEHVKRFIRARLSAPQAVGHLSPDELDLCRQWFDCVRDVNGGYLNKADYMLAQRLYVACGMRVPSSISDMTAPPTQQGDGK